MDERLSWAGREWTTWTPNGGNLEMQDFLRLKVPEASGERYIDAQIDDYATGLHWQPPLTLTLQARLGSTHGMPAGTAGFGFWNDPAGNRLRRWRLPKAVWFFYQSPPGEIALDTRAPGHGWFAMTFNAQRWALPLLAPLAPLALPLFRWAAFRQRFWPLGQWMLGTRMVEVPHPATMWHNYRIDWLPERVRFTVDDTVLLDTPFSPTGPLGLVIWIDNQFAIVRPDGKLGGGLLPTNAQWLDLAALQIDH